MQPALISVGVLILGLVARHYLGNRRDKRTADRAVLDDIGRDSNDFFSNHRKFESLVHRVADSGGSMSEIRRAAQRAVDAWTALEKAASHVGRLSNLRYDGMRTLGSRLYRACNEMAPSIGSVEAIAAGHSSTPMTVLSQVVPWSDLYWDALYYRTYAFVYRRKGPLTPRQRVWWRRRSRREATGMQITEPLRRWINKGKSEAVAISEAVEIVRAAPEFEGSSEREILETAYRLLHGDD